MKNKVILIPGWMNGKGMYQGGYLVKEVWREMTRPDQKLADDLWIIGHSLGANWALLNWKKFGNTKLILVNPPFPRRSVWAWFLNWLRFHKEEVVPRNKEIVVDFRNRIFGIVWCWKFLRYDFEQIMGNIPRENIFVVRGRNDRFFCDEKAVASLKRIGVSVIEVEAGHDWNNNIDRVIEEIINSRKS